MVEESISTMSRETLDTSQPPRCPRDPPTPVRNLVTDHWWPISFRPFVGNSVVPLDVWSPLMFWGERNTWVTDSVPWRTEECRRDSYGFIIPWSELKGLQVYSCYWWSPSLRYVRPSTTETTTCWTPTPLTIDLSDLRRGTGVLSRRNLRPTVVFPLRYTFCPKRYSRRKRPREKK